ncbi:11242_t:CDS:2, partial [Paraglomus occultum]
NPKWNSLPVTNAITVNRPACSVTSKGILYVTGDAAASSDNDYAGVQLFDLTKEASGTWYKPLNPYNKFQHLPRGHKSIVVQTSAGEEVLFIFGGTDYTFILNLEYSRLENVTETEDAPPPYMDEFALTSSKDNIYIISGRTEESGRNLWGFNIPTRKWFKSQAVVDITVGAQVEYAGKLNDTIYLIDSGQSLMWKWNLESLPEAGPRTYGYAFAQLPGSDVFVTYGGKTGSDVVTDSLDAFNMTEESWIKVNNKTDIPSDQYRDGFAPDQDSFLEPPQTSVTSAGNGTQAAHNRTLDITADVIVGILLIMVVISSFLLYRQMKNKKEEEKLKIVETWGAFRGDTETVSRTDIETGSQEDTLQSYRPLEVETSGHCESYSSSSETISAPDFNTPTALHHTEKLNSTPITPSSHYAEKLNSTPITPSSHHAEKLNPTASTPSSHHTVKLNSTPPTLLSRANEIRKGVTPTVFESPSTSSVSPSAPEGTILFNRYKLKGKPEFDISKSVRYAEDETVGEDVAIKFFSDYDSFENEVTMLKFLRSTSVGALRNVFHVSNAVDWKYAMITDYYLMSLDVFILKKRDDINELNIKVIIHSLAQAINYVHNKGIVHLDIQPGNFVREVGSENKWRLIDFESAKVDGEEDVSSSTLRYAPPELIKASTLRTSIKADTSMDMWSFGCTIYELFAGKPLFISDDETKRALLDASCMQHFEFPSKNVSDVQAQHVLKKLLAINPIKRASIEEILRGAYLTGGADSVQIRNMRAEATEEIINTLHQNTNIVLSSMQEATNKIVNSISDAEDAKVPRLFMLLPGDVSWRIFNPNTWGRKKFVIRILCEGLAANNKEAHFTDHPGYELYHAEQFLAKAGPYLNILANLMKVASFFPTLQFMHGIADKVDITLNSKEYFKNISEFINEFKTDESVARDLAGLQNDPLERIKCAQGPALREFETFLLNNDRLREYGGLNRIIVNDGRCRW